METKVINSLFKNAWTIINGIIYQPGLGYVTDTSIYPVWKALSWSPEAMDTLNIEVKPGRTIRFTPKGQTKCYIELSNIRPNARDSVLNFHPYEITNKQVGGVYTLKTTNTSGSNVNRRFTLTNASETSQGQNVGVGLSATIGASVTVGSAVTTGFEVGASFSATVTASYNKQWSETQSTAENREISVDVAPRSIMYIDLQKATGDYRQQIDADCYFDYGIEICLGDAGLEQGEKLIFSSIGDMLTYANGFGDQSDETNGWYSKYRALPNPKNLDEMVNNLKSFPVKYTYVNKFKGASTGEVTVKETDLKGKEFSYND